MNHNLITKEIDWFCFHVVTEGLLQVDSCVAIMNAIEDAGIEANLEIFIQAIFDNQLCDNESRINSLAAMAKEEAKIFGFAHNSVFENYGKQAATEEKTENPESTQAAAPAPESPRRNVDPGKTLGEAWQYNWPQLAEAEHLSKDEAIKLLNDFLSRARELRCSDVHISCGAVPFVRRFTEIYQLADQQVINEKTAEALNLSPLREELRQEFENNLELDYSYSVTEKQRYRVNVMKHRLGIAGSYRVIDEKIPTIGELGFQNPEIIEKLTTHNQGLILITGPAGSGKSSTLNALVDFINKNRQDHIVTIEDPIEIIHQPIKCNVTQRGLGQHTKSFHNALRAVLREDPDVIVIGELRDLETVEMAIRASETGHLVFGTLHTSSAPSTMDRILDVFPPDQQSQIRSMVAESLKAVICQQLLPNKDKTGVVMAAEILLATLAVSNLIREGKTFQISSTIQTSKNIGMSTMEQSLYDLYLEDKRSYEQTMPMLRTPDLIKQMQAAEAQKAAQAAGTGKRKGWF